MKVKISIDQQTKSGFLGGTSHSYKMNVQFQLNEKEKKVFNDHPLFQDMIVIQYAPHVKKDIPFVAKVKDIYEGRPITIERTNVNEIIEFHNEIKAASEALVKYIEILSDILGGREFSFGE